MSAGGGGMDTRFGAPALRRGTEAHYEDPLRYERTYARRTEDIRFYVEVARSAGRGAILELGAGSGRVTLPIARAGRTIVAVDRMAPMLARLRERLAAEREQVRRRVRVVRGDLRSVRIGQRFPLVIAPFNVLMHLYARRDVERALATVRAHLAPKGRFVFDVTMPDLRALLRDPNRGYVARHPFRDPRTGRRYRYEERFQYDAEAQVQMITVVLTAEDDPQDVWMLPLAHRQFFPAELEALLACAGFTIEARWGGFDRSPLHRDAESQVVVARLDARRARAARAEG
jgi:SAM-dependent methyltransferase